jgi:hypothetical protein
MTFLLFNFDKFFASHYFNNSNDLRFVKEPKKIRPIGGIPFSENMKQPLASF